MSQQTYPPSLGEPERMGLFDIWFEALTQPKEEVFVRIARQPNASTGNALAWIFVSNLIVGMIGGIVQTISMRTMLNDPILGKYVQDGLGTFSIGTLVCSIPLGAVLGALAFAVFVGSIQWVAKMFGGIGNFEKLAFAMAAFAIPASLIMALFSLLSLIPYVNILVGLLSFAFFVYVLVLDVIAVKAVNYFGWGQAIGSVFVPIAVFFLFASCCVAALSAMLGSIIQETLNTVNSLLY